MNQPSPAAIEPLRGDGRESLDAATAEFDLVVADASWSWTERLFRPLADRGVRTLLLKACDWRTAFNQRRPLGDWRCPGVRLGENLWQRTFVLPPGWMKSYPRLGMAPLAAAVRAWHGGLERPRPLALAVSYPHYLYLRDKIRPRTLIYYNMDDYGLYWASRREAVRALEARVVAEADLSVFCARIRAEEWLAALPEAAERIIHLPHGAPEAAIPAAPRHRPAAAPADLAGLPRPLLGFVGSLEDRLDWELIGHLADAFPEGSVVLVGREPAAAPRRSWYQSYKRATARPNVRRVGWRDQEQIGRYNASFDVCLIPYRVDHAFNRASCPTKVMDYMATTRPIVATALPECGLYRELFDVADDAGSFIAAVRRIVDAGSDDGRAARRWAAARGATWDRTSLRLLDAIRDRAAAAR